MTEKISVSHHVTQGPNSESTTVAFTVPGGQKFRMCEVEAAFPSGVGGYLQVAVYHGIHKVAPNDGVFKMSSGKAVARTEYTFNADEKVLVWSKNTHSANTYDADVLLEGELE